MQSAWGVIPRIKVIDNFLILYGRNFYNISGKVLQGSSGKGQWTINIWTAPMMINQTTPSLDNNYWLESKDTAIEYTTNQY